MLGTARYVFSCHISRNRFVRFDVGDDVVVSAFLFFLDILIDPAIPAGLDLHPTQRRCISASSSR